MNKKTIVLSLMSLLSLSSLQAVASLDDVIATCKNGAHGTVQFCKDSVVLFTPSRLKGGAKYIFTKAHNASRNISSRILDTKEHVISSAKYGFANAQDALMIASGRASRVFREHPRCVATTVVVAAAAPVLWKTRNKVKSALVKVWKKLPFVK